MGAEGSYFYYYFITFMSCSFSNLFCFPPSHAQVCSGVPAGGGGRPRGKPTGVLPQPGGAALQVFWGPEKQHVTSLALRKPSEDFWEAKTIPSGFWLETRCFSPAEGLLSAREAAEAFWKAKNIPSGFQSTFVIFISTTRGETWVHIFKPISLSIPTPTLQKWSNFRVLMGIIKQTYGLISNFPTLMQLCQ